MRYAGTHKEETHKKLLKIAATQLREKGPAALGVADVMKAAGLTHGGFYAHFKSKDDLLRKALQATFAQSQRRVERLVEGLPPRHALATYIDFYVSSAHRDNIGTGCPITSLNSDLPRQSKMFRTAFEAGLKAMTDRIEGWMKEAGMADAQTLAPSILSAMAGAVALSRTISDRRLSDDLLASSRAGIKARLGLTDLELSKEMP